MKAILCINRFFKSVNEPVKTNSHASVDVNKPHYLVLLRCDIHYCRELTFFQKLKNVLRVGDYLNSIIRQWSADLQHVLQVKGALFTVLQENRKTKKR